MIINDSPIKLIAIFVCIHLILFAGLVHPENNSIQNLTYIPFEWEQVPGAHGYQLQASSTDDFANNIIDTTDSTLLYIDRDNLEFYANRDVKNWKQFETFCKKCNITPTEAAAAIARHVRTGSNWK